jgi:hypothetical protein|tara:strand:- start:4967 stop:5542 length:576 start_codon:yes stop_codon:yes gene_type:complete
MKALNHFIVHIPKKFKDEVSFNGSSLKLVNKFNEFDHRVNSGKIVNVPKGIDKKHIGDTMYFHHHVVIEQRYDIGDNLYLVQYDSNGGYGNHAIGIENKDSDITMLGDWCFVAPPVEKEEAPSDYVVILSLTEEPELEGILLSIPKDSEWIGAKSGDMVGYTKDSEYKMELLNGDKVYRMRTTELVYVKKD